MDTNEPKFLQPLVETDWLATHLEDPHLRILDCSVIHQDTKDGNRRAYFSGRADWERSHIPGSLFVDFLRDLNVQDPVPFMPPPPADFAAAMESLGVGEGTRVILYDSSNHVWAARVWWMLRGIGFDNAVVLNGGWQKWKAEERPVSSEVTSHPPGSLKVKHRPDQMTTMKRLLASLSESGVTIINALTAEEYCGTVNRFPRAGRIAGSVHVDCEHLIDPQTHTYLPEEELSARFNSVGALGGEKIITYCGVSVAASSDALALTLLGVKNVSVDDGGLLEWTLDPELPMEVG